MNKHNKKLAEGLQMPDDLTSITGDKIIYKGQFSEREIILKTFSLSRHGALVHQWANMPYSIKYWGMQGSLRSFRKYYLGRIKHMKTVLLLAFVESHPVAFLEVYQVLHDELAAHYDTKGEDYGVHLLMAPYRQLLPYIRSGGQPLSVQVLHTVLRHLFYFGHVTNVLAEPDTNNTAACRLAEKAGFSCLKEIQLSYKRAALYRYKREDFIRDFPDFGDKNAQKQLKQ